MAALNAYIVWKIKYLEFGSKNKRKFFLEALALNLMKDNVVERKQNNQYLHNDVIFSINLFYKDLKVWNIQIFIK